MKVMQFTWEKERPFTAGNTITLMPKKQTSDLLYLHIGFQIPFRSHFGTILSNEESLDEKSELYKWNEKLDNKTMENKSLNDSLYYNPDWEKKDESEIPDFTIRSYSKRINNKLINGFEQSFRLTDRNVLEFDNIADKEWEITFHKDLPRETIIDIAYE